jgi:hypothetical protein
MGPLDVLLDVLSSFITGQRKPGARRWLERLATICSVVVIALIGWSLFR